MTRLQGGVGLGMVAWMGLLVGGAFAAQEETPAAVSSATPPPAAETAPPERDRLTVVRKVPFPAQTAQQTVPAPQAAPPDARPRYTDPLPPNAPLPPRPSRTYSLQPNPAGMEQTPFPRVVVREGTAYSAPYFVRRYPSAGIYDFYWHGAFGAQRMLEDAYWAGRLDERQDVARQWNEEDMNRRRDRLLTRHQQAMQAGVRQLKAGDYARAIVHLQMAAELDNGDPACRIHLSQAQLAQGHYEEAAKTLRRALQLQPKLVYVDLRLASYYPDGTAFDRQADALAAAVEQKKCADGNVQFLLGFVEFQRGRFDAAHGAFRRAARALPKDSLTKSFLEITKPATTAKARE